MLTNLQYFSLHENEYENSMQCGKTVVRGLRFMHSTQKSLVAYTIELYPYVSVYFLLGNDRRES